VYWKRTTKEAVSEKIGPVPEEGSGSVRFRLTVPKRYDDFTSREKK